LLSVFVLTFVIEISPAQFDTGMIELKQPDETAFTGRIWGDEFFSWAETEDGYRFIQSGDGWYYYATLDQYGEFTPTNYKVGIDTPPPSSYQLERTQARIDEINQMIEEFLEEVELNGQWFAQRQAEADTHNAPLKLKVGVILIEFQDVKHFDPNEFPRLGGYLTSDFDSLMFSENHWYEPNPRPGFPSPHPENEPVFGSFTDYWDQISRGKLVVEGKVVNSTDEGTGMPKWLTANYSIQYYLNQYARFTILANEAVDKAAADGLISLTPGNPNYYDILAVVYAQSPSAGYTGTLGAIPNRNCYVCGERMSSSIFGPDKSFTHIGIHLNSFGVKMGFL
jgi:hypothetical protein